MADILDLINKGKIKRYFQVRHKLSFEGAVYHITQRSPGKEILFVEDADYLFMIHLLKEFSKEFSFDVFSFALMTNHLHVLIRLGEDNLSKAMKSVFEKYAIYFNKKYERKGPVFCKPFRAALCLDDSYLLAASLYIHLNPVKAGIVEDPLEYRWSSYALYKENIKKKSFVNSGFVLGLLDKDITKARIMYSELINRSGRLKIEDVLEDVDGLTIFRNKILKLLGTVLSEKEVGRYLSEATVIDENLEREISALVKKRRLRSPSEMRARKYLIQQLRSRNFTIAEIAEKLKISRQSAYNALNFTK